MNKLFFLTVSAVQIKMNGLTFAGPTDMKLILLCRGLISFLGMVFGFMALTVLSIGDATALSFTAPIFTGIAAHFILHEKWQVILKF